MAKNTENSTKFAIQFYGAFAVFCPTLSGETKAIIVISLGGVKGFFKFIF